MGSNLSLVFAAGIAVSFLLPALAGTSLGVLLAATVIITLLAGTVGRLASHPCPRCGNRVTNGRTSCRACGYDATQSAS